MQRTTYLDEIDLRQKGVGVLVRIKVGLTCRTLRYSLRAGRNVMVTANYRKPYVLACTYQILCINIIEEG